MDTVEVDFSGETKRTVVNRDSTWSVYFTERKADLSPKFIRISNGRDQIELGNVLLGDVWLCIGQSNMEWPMQREMHVKTEKNHADMENLRFYNPTYAGKNVYGRTYGDSIVERLHATKFYQGSWQVSNVNSVRSMSAVGYYFGKSLLEKENVPIGLGNLAIGGAPLETFVSRSALERDARFSGKVKRVWTLNDQCPAWLRERGLQNTAAAKYVPTDGLGPNHAFKPGFAHEAGIVPLMGLPIRGVIWYQGESNAQEIERVKEYGELQQLLVDDYRRGWKMPQLPFYWVQLSSIDTLHYKGQLWPQFRDEQRRAMALIAYGGMAVSSDIGAKNDVHPTNKKEVGERLARWALRDVYGHKIEVSGPLVNKAVQRAGNLIVSFDHGRGLSTSDLKSVRGFTVDGKYRLEANIKNDTIVIPISGKPRFLYYGWKPWSEANLINSDGLPASTFKIKVE